MAKPRWSLLYGTLILFGLALVGIERIPADVIAHEFLYAGALLLFFVALGLWIAANQGGLAQQDKRSEEPLWVVTYDSAENQEQKRQEETKRRVAA